MRKKVPALVLMVLLLVNAVGMGAFVASAQETDKPFAGVTLNVLLEGHPSSNAIKAMTPDFEAATGIKVNCEIIPYEELPQKALLAFSQKSDSYDIIHNDRLYAAGYAANDYIYSLDDFAADSKINQYYDPTDFVPAYLNACKVGDKLYGLPVYGESTFLMYRKDLFEQDGIQVPATMDQLVEAAKAIKEKSNGQIAGITMRGSAGIHVVYTWAGFLWAYGGHWFDDKCKLDIATPEAIKATETYAKLLNDYGPLGYANFGWQENRLLFQQGKAGMTIDATVNGAYCENPDESLIVGKTGYAPVPSGSDKQLGGQHSLAVHELFISKFSKNPEAAFLFATWALNKEQQLKAMEIEPHCGVSSLGAMEGPVFQEKYGAFKDGMLEAISKANVGYIPTTPEASEIIDRVGRALSEVLAGTKTAKDALEAVNTDINTNVIK